MKMPDPDEINLVCPVCGKEFKRNDDTRYIVSGGYTCSWNCFLKRVKTKREENNDEHKTNVLWES